MTRFPSLKIVREVMKSSSSAPIIFNAANEIAVDNFLSGSIRFTEIINVIDFCLQKTPSTEPTSLDAIKAIDENCRKTALDFCKSI